MLSTVHQTRCQMPRTRSTYSPSCYFLFHCPRVALNILLINVPITVLSHEFYSLSLSRKYSIRENAYSPVRAWLPDKKRNQSGKIRSIYYVPTLAESERQRGIIEKEKKAGEKQNWRKREREKLKLFLTDEKLGWISSRSLFNLRIDEVLNAWRDRPSEIVRNFTRLFHTTRIRG